MNGPKVIALVLFLLFHFITEARAGQGLIIENEEITYKMFGTYSKRSRSEATIFQVQCKRIYRIDSKNGAGQLSEIILPEPIDATYYNIDAKSLCSIFHLNNYELEEVDIFIRREGSIIRINKESISNKNDRILNANGLYGNYVSKVYKLPELKIGDRIELKYILNMPYRDNLPELRSFRIFFHSKLKKEKYRVKFVYTLDAPFRFNFKNGAEPQSTFKDRYVTYRWEFTNLPPALAENRSRPWMELPHLEVFCDADLPWNIDLRRTNGLRKSLKNVPIEYHDTQYNLLRRFIQKMSSEASMDSSNANFFGWCMNEVCLKYRYDGDEQIFSGNKPYNFNWAPSLSSSMVSESNKLDFYGAIAASTTSRCSAAFVMDNRIGELSRTYQKPLFSNEFFIVSEPQENQRYYALPKRQTAGFWVNEIPFYYENANVVLHSLNNPHLGSDVYAKTNFDITKLGTSSQLENLRNTVVQLSASETGCRAKFNLLLAGQFSTLSRVIYLHNEALQDIDQQYHKKLWDGLKLSEPAIFNIDSISTTSPFHFELSGEMLIAENYDEGEAEWRFELGDWIKHIRDSVDSDSRTMTYFPDFRHSDRFSFRFLFPVAISMPDGESNIKISNEFAEYTFIVKQDGDNAVAVFSNLNVIASTVPAEHIWEVDEIYRAIDKVRASQLTVKKLVP